MRATLDAMKSALKDLAALIRTRKAERKTHENGYVPDLFAAQREYRHKHIVYCLLRGRTLDQVEPKVRPGNERNELLIHRYWEQYTGHPYPLRTEVAHEAALRACQA